MIYKLKPFPQHFGGGHVMEVRCRCSYLHQHPFQILHSVSWEIRFGEEGSHSPCSASFSRLLRQAEDTVAEFYYACWETPAASPSHRGKDPMNEADDIASVNPILINHNYTTNISNWFVLHIKFILLIAPLHPLQKLSCTNSLLGETSVNLCNAHR